MEIILWFSLPRWNIWKCKIPKCPCQFLFPQKSPKNCLEKINFSRSKKKEKKTSPKEELFEKIYFSRSTPTQSPFLIITSLCKLGKYLGKEENIQLNCPNVYTCFKNDLVRFRFRWRKDKIFGSVCERFWVKLFPHCFY